MKEIVSAFGSDVLRPLVSLVVPGSIATVPGVMALLWAKHDLRVLAQTNGNIAAVAMVLLILFVGLLCEDLGSHIEYRFDLLQDSPRGKRCGSRTKGQHRQEWFEYLRIAYRIEPVGHRYMRTLVLRLKFELGSSVAFVFALLGIWWLPTSYSSREVVSVLPVLLMAGLCLEAKWTHELLTDLRTELLKGARELPPPTLKGKAAQAGG